MVEDLDANKVATAIQVSIGQFIRRLRQAPVEEELTFSELLALSRLDRVGSATTSKLARAEQITPQAMGTTLTALEERGLVERRSDPGDARRMLISMTKTGEQALRSRRSARTDQMAKVLDGFTRAELRTLMAAAPLIERLGEGL
jgi:DNA-binding MarR family transcriptional regulator